MKSGKSESRIPIHPDLRDITAISDALRRHQRFIIVSHLDPDGDALGTQLACGSVLSHLGKSVAMVRDSAIPERYHFLPGISQIIEANQLPANAPCDCLIVLECPQKTRIGSAVRFLNVASEIINIDHHRGNELFGTINWIDIGASSVGEMFYAVCRHLDTPIDQQIATCLYTALLTDTGRFRYDSTSPNTFAVAGALVAAGANPRTICDQVYFQMPTSTLLLLGDMLTKQELLDNGKICVFMLTDEMYRRSGKLTGDTEGFVEYALYGKGVRAGVLLKEKSPDMTKASIRSNGSVNAAAVAARFGGGGHLNAAGCQLSMPIVQARDAIVEALREQLREQG